MEEAGAGKDSSGVHAEQSDRQQDRQWNAEQHRADDAMHLRLSRQSPAARYLLQVATVAAPFTTDHLFFSILTSV